MGSNRGNLFSFASAKGGAPGNVGTLFSFADDSDTFP